MKKILIFAGTTEGKRLTAYLADQDISVHVCTATAYGESLLPYGNHITASHERMNCMEMQELMRAYAPDYVVDATHPYAKEVTANVKTACERCGISYLRLVRDKNMDADRKTDLIFVDSIEEAVRALEDTKGRILVTTGSKELEKYTALSDYEERIYARVLSVKDAVMKCEELGIRGRHLICMQGPFSAELNRAMLKEYDISWLVTKESGAAGGFQEKCEAAACQGVKVIVIGRPIEENGYTYGEIIKILKKDLNLQKKQKVSIVGIGAGDKSGFTIRAAEVCEQADVIIGAKRMTESFVEKGKPVYVSYQPKEIVGYVKAHPEYERVAVLFSGDTGFYSGASRLKEELEQTRKEEGAEIEIEVIPGISSIAYFCSRLGVSWEDARLISVHGRRENVLAAVRGAKKIFVLVGNRQDIIDISSTMTEAGFGELTMCVGTRLSYHDEEIIRGRVKDYLGYDGDNLAVVYIENPEGGEEIVSCGLPDDTFVRGKVPMTKEEIRSVCLSKMRIKRDSIIYDVGAGTGSVSVEAALLAEKGRVYAIERQKDAICLIQENRRKRKLCNLIIAEREAPDILEDLPAPDCVFIGGSGGHLEEIIEAVREKNPNVRVVISAITIETLAKATQYCMTMQNVDAEIVQISVAKSKNVGSYHMMTGQNPIFIISFTCSGER